VIALPNGRPCENRIIAKEFEAAFYGTRDLRDVKPPEEPKQQAVDLTALIEQLQKNPELASTLAELIVNGSNAAC